MNSEKHIFIYKPEPTEENIYYMFQRLITPIIISTSFEPYKKYWNDYEKLLDIVRNWIGIYYNTNKLIAIDNESLEKFESLVTDLKFECLGINTLFIEEIDIWYSELLHLLDESNKMKGDNLCQENLK